MADPDQQQHNKPELPHGVPLQVDDLSGRLHSIRGVLGEGGQGMVLRTANPEIAVKLLTDAGSVSGQRRRELQDRIAEVRALPLHDIALARPIATLRSHLGYAMRFLDRMMPISRLMAMAGTPDITRFAVESGGLGRRYGILARTAAVLAKLHAVPAVYVDLSPNNVFISADPAQNEVWLIDADNVHLAGSRADAVYTAGFGAPEIVRNQQPPSIEADCFSFAVLAHWVLRQGHPFRGARVMGGQENWAAPSGGRAAEEQAFAGELPWVNDPDDGSNFSESMFPLEIVAPPGCRLRELFAATFERGRDDPGARPPAMLWARALWALNDLCIGCPACGASSLASSPECIWCGVGRPRHIRLHSRRCDPEANQEDEDRSILPLWNAVLPAAGDVTVPRRWIEPFTIDHGEDDMLRLRFDRDSMTVIRSEESTHVWVQSQPGQTPEPLISGRRSVPLPTEGLLPAQILVSERRDPLSLRALLSFSVEGADV